MPCLISDTLSAIDETGSLVGLAGRPIVAIPSAIPLSITLDSGLTWHELQGNEIRTISREDGTWSLTLYAHAEEDPNTTDWQIILPDGIVWAGTIPTGVAGPVSLATLKNSYGWGISNKTATAIVTSSGPQGVPGASGAPATPTVAGAVKQTLYIATDYGITGDGVTDNTAAINSLLATLSTAGGGVLYFPPGAYRCNGQIIQPYSSSLGGAAPLTLRGAGNPFAAVPIASPKTTILDLRYDGATGNAHTADFAVVSGLALSINQAGAILSITAGSAYINNPDTTAASLLAIPAPPSLTIGTTVANINAAAAAAGTGTIGNGTWFVDVDAHGNLFFTQSTLVSGGGANISGYGTIVTYTGGAPSGSPTSWTVVANTGTAPNTIRIAQLVVAGGVITDLISFHPRLGKIEARNIGLFAVEDLGIYCDDTARTSDECPFLKTTCATLKVTNVTFQGSRAASIGSPAIQDAIVLGGPGGSAGWSPNLGMYLYETATAASVFAGYGTTVSGVYFNYIRRCVYGRGSANGTFLRDLVIWQQCGAPEGMGAIDLSGTANNPAYSNVVQNVLAETPAYAAIVRLGVGATTNLIDNVTGYDAQSSTLVSGSTTPVGSTTIPLSGACGAPSILGLQGKPLALGASFPSRAERVVVSATAAITGSNPSGGATTASGAAAATSITVSQAAGLSAGQQLLLGSAIGSQDAVTIGPGYAGGTAVPLTTPLLFAHASDPLAIAPWTVPLLHPTLNIHYADLVSTVVAMVRADSTSAVSNLIKGGSGPAAVLPASDPSASANGHNAPAIAAYTASGFTLDGVSQLSPPVNGTAATALAISTQAEYNTALDIIVTQTVYGLMHGAPIRLIDGNGHMIMKIGQDNVNRLYPSIMSGSATDPGGSQPLKISGYGGTNINTDTIAEVTIGNAFVTVDTHGQVNAKGFSQAIAAEAAAYTLTTSDGVIIVTANSLTITLPAAASGNTGRVYTIKNGAATTGTSLASLGGTIDGAASPNTTVLSAALAVARCISDGTNWWLI